MTYVKLNYDMVCLRFIHPILFAQMFIHFSRSEREKRQVRWPLICSSLRNGEQVVLYVCSLDFTDKVLEASFSSQFDSAGWPRKSRLWKQVCHDNKVTRALLAKRDMDCF